MKREAGKSTWGTEKIEEALSGQHRADVKVDGTFTGLAKPFDVFVLVNPKEYSAARAALLKKFSANMKVIYISLGASYSKIRSELKKPRVSLENIFVIDMISTETGSKKEKYGDVAYLGSPTDMTEAMVLVERRLRESNEDALVVLDSVSAMMIYSGQPVAEKFVHALLNKAASQGASIMILSTDYSETENITGVIAQFFGKTVKI